MNCEESLSIVLAVHNAPRQLTERVGRLLEILPEIALRFELLILDNGSTDQTEEIAYDLARNFPQIRVFRHPRREAEQVTINSGLQQTCGDLVVIYDEQSPIRAKQLADMWKLRKDRHLVIARPATAESTSLLDRLSAWAAKVQNSPAEQTNAGGLQIIRRRAIEEPEPEEKPADERPRQRGRRRTAPRSEAAVTPG